MGPFVAVMAMAATDQSPVKYQGHIVLKCRAHADNLHFAFSGHQPMADRLPNAGARLPNDIRLGLSRSIGPAATPMGRAKPWHPWLCYFANGARPSGSLEEIAAVATPA